MTTLAKEKSLRPNPNQQKVLRQVSHSTFPITPVVIPVVEIGKYFFFSFFADIMARTTNAALHSWNTFGKCPSRKGLHEKVLASCKWYNILGHSLTDQIIVFNLWICLCFSFDLCLYQCFRFSHFMFYHNYL